MDSKDKFTLWLALLGTAIMLALIGLLYSPVRAEEKCNIGDINCYHDRFHSSFYKDLKRPHDGFSCCSGGHNDDGSILQGGDCRPSILKIVKGEYVILVDGAWCPVSEDKLVAPPKDHPDGVSTIAHVCARYNKENPCANVYCFVPPVLQ